MKKNSKYYIDKNNKVTEMVYENYEVNNLYLLSPKRQKQDELMVSNILITDKKLIEKIVKKKIELKLERYIKIIKSVDPDDDSNWGVISQTLMDAERFRMKLVNEYLKYLGKEYRNLSLEKIELVIEELRKMRYTCTNVRVDNYAIYNEKGKGR